MAQNQFVDKNGNGKHMMPVNKLLILVLIDPTPANIKISPI